MNTVQIVLLLLAAISIVVMGVIYYKTKKPLRMFITSAVIGAAGFTLVNLLAGQTGVYHQCRHHRLHGRFGLARRDLAADD